MKKMTALLVALTLLLALTACGAKADDKTITVGATPAPHCEILEVAKTILDAKGIVLDSQEYDDYVIPNDSVEEGDGGCGREPTLGRARLGGIPGRGPSAEARWSGGTTLSGQRHGALGTVRGDAGLPVAGLG